MADQPVDSERRRFLLCSSAAVAVVCGKAGGLTGCGMQPPRSDAGDAGMMMRGAVVTNYTPDNFAVGTFAMDEGNGFILGRDAMGFYAYSNICTHEAFPVPVPDSNGRSVCTSNHGGVFNANGDLVMPPTMRPIPNQPSLPHFVVTLQASDAGASPRVVVHTNMEETNRMARTPVPAR